MREPQERKSRFELTGTPAELSVREVTLGKRIGLSMVLVACAAACLVFSYFSPELGLRVIGVVGALFSCLCIALLWLSHSWEPRVGLVRYSLGNSLHIGYQKNVLLFVAPLLGGLLALGMGMAGLLVTVQRFLEDAEFGHVAPFKASTWAMVLIPMSLGLIFTVLRTRKLPVGVDLNREGVSARETQRWRSVSWNDISGVWVEVGRYRILYVVLALRESGTVRVSAQALGSDPNVVAAIIRFYLEHPEHRDALSDPEEALKRFRNHAF